ncbi:hypothetical protein V5799_030714, partial [Amblyomma americanum]
AFLCHASDSDHASSTCFVVTSFKDLLLLLPSLKAPTCDGPSHVIPSTPSAAMITDSARLSCAMLQLQITPQAFLCHASASDHASSTCFVVTTFKDHLLLQPSWKAATWDGPAHMFLSTPTAAIITAFLCHASASDHASSTCFVVTTFKDHLLLLRSWKAATWDGPAHMFLLTPTAAIITAFLCHASTFDHASSTCFVATSFKDNLSLLPSWKAATWDGLAHVFSSTPTAAMITDSTSYLSSVDIEQLCAHGEAFRMKTSETFILFLQAFLCHASTLDHASSTCFVATSFKENLSLLPAWKAATWDGPAHVFPSAPTAAMITDSARLSCAML